MGISFFMYGPLQPVAPAGFFLSASSPSAVVGYRPQSASKKSRASSKEAIWAVAAPFFPSVERPASRGINTAARNRKIMARGITRKRYHRSSSAQSRTTDGWAGGDPTRTTAFDTHPSVGHL